MLTPDKIREELLRIIAGIRNPPFAMTILPLLPYTQERFNALIDRCIELHRQLTEVKSEDDTSEHSQVLFAIEAEYRRLRARLLLFPSVLITYFCFFCVFLVIRYVDIAAFVKSVLKVDAPERLITFGLAGAFLYLATSVLAALNREEGTKDAASKTADFTIRILLAMVVPVVLVALFFSPDGEINAAKLSPELLAFACGYSAKLVVDLFNKIVEKCSKMIEAL
ncbi:hypothetical protein [Comamonas sp. UBA7528]|uniref:hypothetical protein n=1 Tax=Comamonas sp. UBA7528 TaxID=1946391 RepID=UPI0025BE3AA9|nr:hypothetical protein [Comamonas sp. UBA7528]